MLTTESNDKDKMYRIYWQPEQTRNYLMIVTNEYSCLKLQVVQGQTSCNRNIIMKWVVIPEDIQISWLFLLVDI